MAMQSQDRAREASVDSKGGYQDCLSCKVVGVGAFAGVGTYAMIEAKRLPPGTQFGKQWTPRSLRIVAAGRLEQMYRRNSADVLDQLSTWVL